MRSSVPTSSSAISSNLAGLGRSAITGRNASGVWDYIPLKVAVRGENFTKSPHLTHGINERAVQRHYRSQRSAPILDAMLEFDLRTALPKGEQVKGSRVHSQDQWLRAAYSVLASKRSNYQIQVGADFPFSGKRSKLSTREATTLVAETWIACRPILWAALGK
jgi:hypothetical protein